MLSMLMSVDNFFPLWRKLNDNSPEKTTGKCIDHCWHSLEQRTNVFAVSPPLTDHYAIVTGSECKVTQNLIKHKFRSFSADNFASFRLCIEAEFSSYRAISQDVNVESKNVMNYPRENFKQLFFLW